MIDMTDLEYIFGQAKKFRFSGWDECELRKCVDMLPNLSRQELVRLYRSQWIASEKVLKECIFNVLFADKIGKRERDIKAAETVTLVERFKDKGSGDVALIRAELQKRYTEGLDCELIAQAFSEATKKDQQWVKSRSGNK